MKIEIPQNVNTAISCLNRSGFDAYVVGGCVRDACLNKKPNDWDVTTGATPAEMKEVFADYRVIETGLRHGTLSVIIDGEVIEITTMRVDGEYSDNRHPDYVEFTTQIEYDLSRRDFTVNAMAYHPEIGFVDPFGGMNDVKNKIIRCVGEADKRFCEDALRIMRALRFSSTLDFDIDSATACAILKNRELLKNVANERIRIELLKLLCGKRVRGILTNFSPVFFEIIPELKPMKNFPQNTPYHIYDVWEHTVVSVSSVEPDPVLRMTMLLHDIGKPQMHTVDENGISHFKQHQQLSFKMTGEILKRLRFSKAEQIEIGKLILYHDWRPKGKPKEIYTMASQHTPDFLLRLLPVLKADAMAQNPINLQKKLAVIEKTKALLNFAIETDMCLSIKALAVDGNDLKKIGIFGSEIKSTLENVLNLIISGKLKNVKQDILTYINKNQNFN